MAVRARQPIRRRHDTRRDHRRRHRRSGHRAGAAQGRHRRHRLRGVPGRRRRHRRHTRPRPQRRGGAGDRRRGRSGEGGRAAQFANGDDIRQPQAHRTARLVRRRAAVRGAPRRPVPGAARRSRQAGHKDRVRQAPHRRRSHGTAVFDDGSRAEFDVLVGADGIHSTVRRLIDPKAPGPKSPACSAWKACHDTTCPNTQSR